MPNCITVCFFVKKTPKARHTPSGGFTNSMCVRRPGEASGSHLAFRLSSYTFRLSCPTPIIGSVCKLFCDHVSLREVRSARIKEKKKFNQPFMEPLYEGFFNVDYCLSWGIQNSLSKNPQLKCLLLINCLQASLHFSNFT